MSLLTRAMVALTLAAPAALAAPQTLTLALSPEVIEHHRTYQEMQRETARLLTPAEFAVSWLPKNAAMGDSFEQLVVLRFTGICRSSVSDEPAAIEAGSLASTAVTNGQVLPFVEVDCDRTRRVLAPALAALPSAAREVLFGRAIGRVLAHELYHVLAQTTVHSDRGVSKPCFRMADLISTSFNFDPVSIAQMRPVMNVAVRGNSPAASAPALSAGPGIGFEEALGR